MQYLLSFLIPSSVNLPAVTSEFCHRRLLTSDPKKPPRPPGLPAELRGTQPVPAELYCPGRSDRQHPEGRSASRLIMLPALLVRLPQRVRRWPIYQDSAPPAPRLARVSTCISLAAFSATQRIHQNGVIRVNGLQVLFRACAGTSFLSDDQEYRHPNATHVSVCRTAADRRGNRAWPAIMVHD